MNALWKKAEPGALDNVLEDVLEVIEAEVWGEIGEEKEAGAFVGGCKEAKRARGVDSYQLLASGITFRSHIAPLLQPVCPLLLVSWRVCQGVFLLSRLRV